MTRTDIVEKETGRVLKTIKAGEIHPDTALFPLSRTPHYLLVEKPMTLPVIIQGIIDDGFIISYQRSPIGEHLYNYDSITCQCNPFNQTEALLTDGRKVVATRSPETTTR